MHKFGHIVAGCFISMIGILILRQAHLVTGGAPGLALAISYLTDLPFSVMFIVVNLPFYGLSLWKMGWDFTLSTLLAAVILAGLTGIDWGIARLILPDAVSAILGGAIAGFGLSYLFWNGASLGGVNILVLYLNRQFGWDPGKVTLVVDCTVVLTGIYAVGLRKGLFSLLSVVVLSLVISFFKGKIAARNRNPASS